mmetsp:Transcript_40397/g.72559  ORF Transcript_40397/g.72559 Transcript_40397/m.72559 type:complete len:169 (+) Transcript_40397:59-565(+)
MGASVDLKRYIDAQNGVDGPGTPYRQALLEIQHGSKRSCWIWYVFPQFLDPARASSTNNQTYQLRSRAEAVAFLQDETLGPRFHAIAEAVAKALESAEVNKVMGGSVDAKKLHQSVTCFHLAAVSAELHDTAALLSLILERLQAGKFEFEDPVMKAKWDALAETSGSS